MANQFFGVRRGLNLDRKVEIIPVNGAPSGGDADVVGIGSLAIDYTNGHLYQKNAAGTGADKWQFIGADQSWREPAEVRENVATTVPSGTPGAAILVDGVSITDGQRVLFSAINPGSKNVYIYQQTPGTFVESTNEPTGGDTLYILQGTDAGKTYTYNGTDWIQAGGTGLDELGFIRTFIGKTAAGSETPTYTSQFQVTTGDNLEVAIGKLDAAIGPNARTTGSGAGAVVLDAPLVDDLGSAMWIVTARQGANVSSLIVFATHDGQALVDATQVDDTQYALLDTGTITGFDVTVTLTGAAATQAMTLTGTATGATDWSVHRIGTAF